ncbi:hypothetical protein NQ314_016647 [Rhamnusium bicolor]|uniref:Large ribosomal subunit protein mL45 n=1 Tax=Rhamnusium bicolor TaxID=1586634 RepID=A0AAV8WV44_9CUCU|nr:hypothetical protein NQ314_016647 [Rhamnusium bicolor]
MALRIANNLGLRILQSCPNLMKKVEELSEEQIRSRMKEHGLLPSRPWVERQFFIHSTGGVFEPYIPPEGDGKISPISKQGAMQSVRFLEKKTKTMMAVRKIRQFEEDFDTPEFCKEATKIYIRMHEMMVARDKDNIIDVITERAYPEVMHNLENKTIRWKYIKDVELPRVVQARCTDIITKENIFGQITVRFHTQQVSIQSVFSKGVLLWFVTKMEKRKSETGIWRVCSIFKWHEAFSESRKPVENQTHSGRSSTSKTDENGERERNLVLAIYDRFGRLMHGSEIVAKDVLEYVVFEKHLANEYGVWRVHAKIIPDWMPPREPSATTYKKVVEPIPEPETAVIESETKEQVADRESNTPSLA